MTYDLIALGESMVSFSPPEGRTLADAPALGVEVAGAESNTCVGLARLGFRVAWVSRLGADPFGDRVLAALGEEGVDTRWARRDAERPTGLMFKDREAGRSRYYRAGSAASELSENDLEGVPVAEARAVLVTGITALIGPRSQGAALALLRAARGLRVVDPNFRLGLWGSARRAELVAPLAESCDVLLAGGHELAELLGAGDLEALARRAAARGPREVVVRGEERVGVFEAPDRWTTADIRRVDTPDPTGAGDAFNAGYAAARLRGETPAAALGAAVRCGTAVATSPGDWAGFPRRLGGR
jgi:2-dehydro-3-deoxygluconokinase